jgi:Mrp family chromosome partitioning ATPase
VATHEDIRQDLDSILVPGVMRSVVKMNLVRDVTFTSDKVDITLSSTAMGEKLQELLKEKVKTRVSKRPGLKEVNISFLESKPKDINKIDNIIAIMSGKGGVGKSLITALTAITLRRQGCEVGILDADITGPSIPKMFGINARPMGSDSGILPVSSKSGIEVMSTNLILPSEDDAVIWRGPLIGRMITQFWEEVLWGKLNYLIVDLPPGTADAPLTVLQTLPVSGIIIVFTPQDLTAMVVRKAIDMVRQMGKPILGVIENMSYLYVPELQKNIEIFGKSRGEEMSKAAEAPLLGQLPIDPQLARVCDEGDIETYDGEIMSRLGESLARVMPTKAVSGKDKND